ncbi:MAG TPA: 8-amino-7-oxononanoate synthase [Bdellovibrionales bacterium]|nr:MAG: 8-amino-7-oxononanoate synthase [Bdellovibrionales bacterium GWB1_52_6]OFZ05746.1 MAG: 8-amino-7-oxononanoate synthase [Bdellovibrionales bacterium GWA1_52_35]OFZ36085.1 MAG: 8-amino-7-oxononanoate synthase [Bdellovibrionales bacterium GWC1_52_8]HAR44104.1 8-amino-7-oxononanoate synthase [Bdellovibrionales bacterium]HCM40314.1 8-amino-7-oxononanoate synthase [Bdellovibrionales bacterium]
MNSTTDLFDKCLAFDDAKRVQAAGVYPFFRPIEASSGSSVVTHGKKRVMIGSNNYLGLTHHPRVQAAAKKAIDTLGTGCTGSRFLNGNLVLHEQLEERLSHFLGKEACLVFSTGFLSNQGAISSLIGRNDVIYSDRENHASIIEGTRVSIGDTVKFKHNNMEDLERVMAHTRHKYEGALLVADGVFSMSGDIFHLPQAIEIARKYNCRIYVDDAHSLGVLGPKGQGTETHFKLSQSVDIVMGTFSKSFASIGGFIAGSADVVHYIKHKARPFMFSAAMPPAAAATVLECINVVEEEPEHLENLWRNARKMSKGLKSLGYNTLDSQTPIIPLLVGDDFLAFSFTQKLYEMGVFATPVVRPAVPEGCALIRTSYMASHTDEDLDYVLDVLDKLGREFEIIGNKEREEQLAILAETHFGHTVA